MAWVKRNLFLLIGGLVALALLGVAGFYLYQRIQEDTSVTEELDQQTEKLKGLVNRPVHPGTEKVNNIAAAKDDEKRLQAFLGQARKQFAPPVVEKELNNRTFRGLLDTTVSQMQQLAMRSGMTLPVKDYWYTFGGQKSAVEFKDVGSLAARLEDIKALNEILCDAKVPTLISFKRVPSEGEAGYIDFLSTGRSVTNEMGIAAVTPYEVTFQGFSGELARVMEGLVAAPQCFIVKTLGVDKAPATPAQGAAAPPPPDPAALQRQMMMMRYGGMNRYNNLPPPVAAAPTTPQPVVGKGGLTTVLDENKLRFTLALEVVKLLPPSK